MESAKFDELIKRVGTARISRLTALRGLAGGALAALAGVAVATDTEAGKRKAKKRKAKKKSRNSVAPAPTYGTAPAPKEPEKPIEEPEECPEDSYEDCGYDAKWDDTECRCICNKENHDFCHAKDDAYYLYGTCVDTRCENDYDTYNPDTCKCEPIVCDNEPKDGCGYGTWDKKTCSCKCDDYYAVCDSPDAYDPYLLGICVDTRCPDYETYDSSRCKCKEVCKPSTCEELKVECGKVDDGCGTELDCGDCKGKEYYDNAYCDEATGKCACDAYTRDDCRSLVDTYADECKYDPYGEVEVKDGCGGKVTCPCKVDRA